MLLILTLRFNINLSTFQYFIQINSQFWQIKTISTQELKSY